MMSEPSRVPPQFLLNPIHVCREGIPPKRIAAKVSLTWVRMPVRAT